jgi:hypothetical protein
VKLDEALAIVAGYKRVVGQDQIVKWIAPGTTNAAGLPTFTKTMDAAYKLTRILAPNEEVGGCSWEPGSGTAKLGDGPFCIAANPALAICLTGLVQKLETEKNP